VFQIGKLCILGKTNECPDVGLVEHYKMVKKKRLHIDGWRPT
jgi:hypothetical protein